VAGLFQFAHIRIYRYFDNQPNLRVSIGYQKQNGLQNLNLQPIEFIGGDEGDRTPDLSVANAFYISFLLYFQYVALANFG